MRSQRRWVLGISLVAFLTIFVYVKTPGFGFVTYDDPIILTSNPAVQHFDIKTMLTRPVASDRIPITLISFAVEYAVFGANPAVYHVDNVVLHVADTILVIWLFYLLFGGFWTPILAGAVFGVHPLHVESVAWVTERKDVLFAFFYILAMCIYLKYVEKPTARALLSIFALFILATFSKAMALSLPAVFFLLDYAKKRPLNLKLIAEKIPMFFVAAVVVLTHPLSHRAGHIAQNEKAGVATLAGQIAEQLGFYVSKLFVPWHLSAVYEWKAMPRHYATDAAVLVLLLAVAVYFYRRRERVGLAGILFFLGTLLPVLRIVPYQNAFAYADRYVYVSSIGIMMALACVLARVPWKKQIVLALSAVVVIFAAASFARTGVWKDDEALWDDVIEKYPATALAHHNKGAWLYQHGDEAGAMTEFQKSLEIDPGYAAAYNSLATIKLKSGDAKSAETMFLKALEANEPNSSVSHFGLAKAYQMQGDRNRALQQLKAAVAAEPDNYLNYYDLGVGYYDFGMLPEGMEQFQKCLEINPYFADAHLNLGFGYFKSGRVADAEKEFARALQLKPDSMEARKNLEMIRGIAQGGGR